MKNARAARIDCVARAFLWGFPVKCDMGDSKCDMMGTKCDISGAKCDMRVLKCDILSSLRAEPEAIRMKKHLLRQVLSFSEIDVRF